MSADPREIRDLLAAVALGAATPEETARVEAAAAADPLVAAELAELREATDHLALDVPEQTPPPGLERAVMAAVRADAEGAPAAARPARAPAPGRRRARRSWDRRGWPVATAVAATLAVGLLVANIALVTRDGDPATERVPAEATGVVPGVSGEAVVVDGADAAVVRLSGVPSARPGRGYALWVLGAGPPVSAGFLASTDDGDLIALAPGVAGADALAVTEEPITNRSAPTSAPLVEIPL